MQTRMRAAVGVIAGVAVSAMLLTGCTSAPSAPTTAPTGDDAVELDMTPTVLPDVECVDPTPGGTPVKLMLQWLPQAQFSGYYAAECLGYFDEVGLDVELVPTGGDIVPQDALFAGDADYAVAWVPKVLGSIEANGIDVTNIAQVFQASGTTQVSFKGDGVASVADFAGKRIGSWGFGNEWEIFAAMAAEGLDSTSVSITTQDFSMNALLDGDVDAAQAMTYNELAQLLETVNPETGALYTVDDLDIVFYEDTVGGMLQDAIWARTADLADPAFAAQTTAFLKAVAKGWIYARDNVEEAASISYAAATAPGQTAYPVGPGHQLWQANEVNKLIWTGTRFGVVDPGAWDQTVAGSLSAVNQDGQHLITTDPPASAFDSSYIEAALAELEAEGVDVVGAGFTPIVVTLKAGGI
ncbi:MAG TPA: ABC transporter substrate-binding protein [Microbacteriaceae bacterium]|nr:ABC transporter substrate-binding protein [Microbacteriaceae bacterium]